MCYSTLENLPKFGCSDKPINIKRNSKGRNSLRPIRNITRKINTRRNSSKGINLRENLKPTHLKV